ncbi:restriction endonuclease subunit S [Campylobacter sp. LH-2024]|uniref:restriction endonuclease subunit S n=3 Tax=Campylobacter TaxID=194 RepID=UPI003AA812B2
MTDKISYLMTNLPQGWEVKRIGDIVKLKNGFAFKSNLFCNDGIPIIRIKNIQNENVILDDLVFCNPDDYKNNLDNYLIFKNDILIAMSGATTGKIGIYNLNDKAYLNQRIGLLRIDNSILRKYIFWFLYCNSEQNLANAFGAAQPNLNTEQIHNIQIPLPPLKEQERIVGILDESFAKIDESIKILEQDLLNLDELMQSALQKAFNPLKDDIKENYQLPQGWEVKRIGDIVKLKNGFAFKSNLFCNDGIPIIRIKNIQNENVILDDLVFCNPDDYKNNLDNYLIFKNDILIAMSGATTGKIGIYNLNDKAYLNQRIGLLRIDNSILRKYIFWFLYCNSEQNLANAFGAAQPNLNTEQIHNIQIPIPPLKEQEQIVSYLDELFLNIKALKENYKTQIKDYEELKKSLLKKAFEGRL